MARLESVYTPKAYRGFESPSLRQRVLQVERLAGLFYYNPAVPFKNYIYDQ